MNEDYRITERDQYNPFLVGDVVSRDGTDEHLVYEATQSLIGVVCIKEPSGQWTKIGETESNVNSRYSFLYKYCNFVEKVKQLIILESIDDYDRKAMQDSIDYFNIHENKNLLEKTNERY